MPLYEYQCKNCGQIVEIRHSMSDTAKTCSKCQKETLELKIGKPIFILKGSGWFQTDYAKPKKTD